MRSPEVVLPEPWAPSSARAYAYLLGAYLGDGHICFKAPGSWTLLIACDRSYPDIQGELADAISAACAGARARIRERRGRNAVDVCVSGPWLAQAFPQHGPGHKHERAIALEAWQTCITHAHPDAFIRGLIQSDGCRCTNRFERHLPSGRCVTYEYVRYFFSNESQDIRAIFRAHCELLGVRVTQSNRRNLSIADRRSVRVLETVAGVKR